MFCGHPTLCLNVKDLKASQRFYEAFGFETFEELAGQRIVLRRGHFTIGLFAGLNDNSINFRGVDVAAVRDELITKLPELSGEVHAYNADEYEGASAAGVCWLTQDPDGNCIFLDTNEKEQGAEYQQQQVSQILRNTEQALIDAGASDECLSAFRTGMLQEFVSTE